MTFSETALKDAEAFIKGLETAYLGQVSDLIAHEIKQRRKDGISDAKEQIRKIAAAVGMSPTQLLAIKEERKHSEVLYIHPHDKRLQWAGLGRKPLWLTELLAAGAKLEDFKAT